MKKLSNLFAVLSAFFVVGTVLGASPNCQLMMSKFPDPTTMTVSELNDMDIFHPFVACTDNDTKEWTVMVWLRLKNDEWTPANPYSTAYYNLSYQSMYSTRQAMSSSEGGHPLIESLCDHEYNVPLLLDGGTWARTNLLPETYDDGNIEMEAWSNGCYVVNIQTDHDIELYVGGYEQTIKASTEMQVFNVQATILTDRSVVITTDPSAIVYFGIAPVPLVEFHGETVGYMGTDGDTAGHPEDGIIGINPWEYSLFIQRARVNDDLTISNQLSVLYFDTDYWRTPTVINPRWKTPEAKFGNESRISACVFSNVGLTNRTMYVYGAKLFKGWLSNQQLSTIRDQDYEQMVGKGISFTRDQNDFWDITYLIDTIQEPKDIVYPNIKEVGSQLIHDVREMSVNYQFTATLNVRNGDKSIYNFNASDIEWGCPTTNNCIFTSNKVQFPAQGTYVITGTDYNGNTRTNTIDITGYNQQIAFDVKYKADTQRTWQQVCNDTVVDKVIHGTNDGRTYTCNPGSGWGGSCQFKRWKSRRIYCAPIESGAGWQGHRAMHVLSPHVYASASHYNWWVGGTQKYISEDYTKTSVVNTTSGMYKLGEWAQANRSLFTDMTDAEFNEVMKHCGDICVNKFTSGTVDPDICPYFLTPELCDEHFGTSCVFGWTCYQNDLGYGIPIAINSKTYSSYSGYDYFGGWWRSITIDDWVSTKKITTYNNEVLEFSGLKCDACLNILRDNRPEDGWKFCTIYPGDSGLGQYIDFNGKLVIVSHHTSTGGGPSYIRSWKILKKYIELAGDEFKILQDSDIVYPEYKSEYVYGGYLMFGTNVTNIADNNRSNYTNKFNEIIFSDTIKTIGNNAFKNCSVIKSVVLPDTITNICDSSFENCTNITDLILSKNLCNIGNRCFKNCTGIQTLTIPLSVKHIGNAAFYGCNNLNNIKMLGFSKTDVKDNYEIYGIKEGALVQCIDGYYSVGEDVNYPHETVFVPENGLLTIGSDVTQISNSQYQGRTDIKNVIMINNITSIGNNAFDGCSNLTNIIIPASVTSIGNNVFHNCNNLTTATMLCYTKNSIQDLYHTLGLNTYVRVHCSNGDAVTGQLYADYPVETQFDVYTGTLMIGSSVEEIAEGEFDSRGDILHVVMTNSVKKINACAFVYCENLQDIILPNSITYLGEYFLDYCFKIEKLIIPDSVLSIDSINSGGFDNIKYIKLPKNMDFIQQDLLRGFDTLETVVFPEHLKEIGDSAFYMCENLNFDQNSFLDVTNIGEGAFQYCKKLSCINLPKIKSIKSVFNCCINLQNINTAPLEYISQFAFCYCPLTNINIASNCILEKECFNSCCKINSFVKNLDNYNYIEPCYIVDKLTGELNNILYVEGDIYVNIQIYNSAFANNTNITSVKIGNQCKNIPQHCFAHCTSITNVTIEYGVESINLQNGNDAFLHCKNLQTIEIPNSVKYIGDWFLECCTSIDYVCIPSSVTNTGKRCFSETNIKVVDMPGFNKNYCTTKIGIFNRFNFPNGCVVHCADGDYVKYQDTGNIYHDKFNIFVIGKNTTSINSSVIQHPDLVKDIYVPNNVTSVANGAFTSCTSIEHIQLEGINISTVTSNYSNYGIKSGTRVSCSDGDYTVP